MPVITLERNKHAELAEVLSGESWTVACLCAGWCNVCETYRADFAAFAQRHPGVHFAWIDVEDNADLVGDIDIENFPTILIQRGDIVAFFGTVVPDSRVAERILLAQQALSVDELVAESRRNDERRAWQEDANLLHRLDDARGQT